MERTSILLPTTVSHASRPAKSLSAKLGIGAFLFFLIKGLAWLLVPLVATIFW